VVGDIKLHAIQGDLNAMTSYELVVMNPPMARLLV
jgi:hypothetical protein